MKIAIKISAFVLLVFSLNCYANSTAASYTRINQIGAEYVAMGCAGEAVTEDIFSIYWNPAGLVSMANKKLSAEESVRDKAKSGDIEQITEDELKNFNKPAKKKFFVFGSSASLLSVERELVFSGIAFNMNHNVFAAGASAVYSDEIQKRDSSGKLKGETQYAGMTGYLSFGYYMKTTSIGLSIKPLYEIIDDMRYAGGSADIGIKTELFKLVKLGFVFQDIGIGLYPLDSDENINQKYERGSPLIRIGIAISPQNSNFTAASSVIKKLETDTMELNFGVNYFLTDWFAVSTGFNDNSFTVGCKTVFSLFEIAYALAYDNIDGEYNNTVSIMMVF